MHTPQGYRGAFRTDDAARALYAEGAGIFRIVPAAVAVPADRDDLVALVQWAGQTGRALVPRGAGSGMPGGNVGPGVVVDLRRGFREGPAVDGEGHTARAGAGVTCAELNARAAVHGLRLPPDPSSARFCTLGGMVSTNAAGARTLKYGSIRAWVTALDVVTADGEVGRATTADPARSATTAAERRLLVEVAPWLRQHQLPLENAPPRTRKNSSGYRLTGNVDDGWVRHLLIGSEGTLALVTGVEVRLAPVPKQTLSMLIPLRALEEIAPMVLRLSTMNPVSLAAIELLDRTYLEFARALGVVVPADAEAVLLVEIEDGDAPPSPRDFGEGAVIASDPETSDRIWSLRHRASPILAALPDTTRSLQLVEDGCVPLDNLGAYIAGLRRIATQCGFPIVMFGHAGDGHVHANILADVTATDLMPRLERCLDEATTLQITLGGTTSGEHGDGRLRAPFLERLFGATYAEACRRVKGAMDPAGILNPGVKLLAAGSRQLAADSLKVGKAAPALPPGIAELLRDIERNARWDEDRLGLLDAQRGAPV